VFALSKIRSLITLVVIFLHKIEDNIYRFFRGIPTLKRSRITAELYLGSQYNSVGLNKLKALGITAIVNMRMNSVYEEARYEGIKYLHLPTVDNTPPSLETLIKGCDFISREIKRGGKVYVHCRQGLGRGPTMAIAYLIKSGLTFNDAFALVKKVRTFINPRAAQIAVLKEVERHYHNEPR
jgi:dual specificity MAP kinase phosphatase